MLNKKTISTIFGACFISLALFAETQNKFFTHTKWRMLKIAVKPTPAHALRIPEVPGMNGATADMAKKIKRKGLKLPFVAYPNGGILKMPSSAYICFDKTNLYAYLTGKQSIDYTLKANKQVKESGQIWRDDNFEMFVDPFISQSEYVHFIVNPISEMYDAQCLIKMVSDPKAADQSELTPKLESNIGYSSGAKVKAIKGNGEWSVLFIVPFSSFGLDSAPLGQPWGFNFCHTNREITELSQWKVTSGGLGFNTPSKYGVLIFGDSKPPVPTTFSMNVAGYGENIITMRCDSPKTVNSAISISTSVSKVKTEKKITLPKGRSVNKISFNVPWNAKGKCKITANLKVNDQLTGFYIQNLELDSPFKLSIPLREIYTTDKEILGSVKLFLGEKTLKQAKLRLSLNNKSVELLKIEGNLLSFGINSQGMKPGKHTIVLKLIVGEKCVCERSVDINVMDSPFGF